MEEQCKLEYGLDLNGVLRQFRRSSDYLKILEIRAKELNVFFTDVMFHSLDWNLNKMKQRIETDFGLNETRQTTRYTPTTSTTATARTRFLRSKLSGRRQDMDPQHYEEHEKILDKINRVDNYPKLKSYLSAAERNRYKDIGFEIAGEIIHSSIYALGGSLQGNTPTPGSTRLTLPGQTFFSTTEHMVKHIPTDHELQGSQEMHPKATTKKGSRFVLVTRFYPRMYGR